MKKKIGSVSQEDQNSLSKRYLLWLYKTTRDEADKIERKFTQLDIDREVEKLLKKKTGGLKSSLKAGVSPFMEEWKEYIFRKESDGQKLKFTEEFEPDPKYIFLRLKLEAIENIMKASFGAAFFKEARKLYEDSCIQRILADTSGQR